MDFVDHPTAFCIIVAIQLIGLTSVVAARTIREFANGPSVFWLLILSVAAVGFLTGVLFLAGSVLWFPCGVTLSLMVVGTTFDLRREVPAGC
jgi:hypothetical protein